MGLTKASTLDAKEFFQGEATSNQYIRAAAAASLVAGAALLVTGRKRAALAAIAAGTTATLLERPEAAQELWASLPDYIRQGQDFLHRAEDFVENLAAQANRIRETLTKAQAG